MYVHNDPMAYIDPDGQLAFLLVPFAISCAIDMCLPAAAALAETYLGGAMAAAFVMGMGQGYNADYYGTNPFEAVDSGSYWCGKAGMLVGGMISAGNPKNYIKAAGQALFKGATSAGVAMGEKAVTNMAVTGTKKAAGAAAAKTTQAAERVIIKQSGEQLKPINPQGNVAQLEAKISDWLGAETRMVYNKAGDPIFLSKCGTRKIRFDFVRSDPHINPHGHIEELIHNSWIKSGPVYPYNILPH